MDEIALKAHLAIEDISNGEFYADYDKSLSQLGDLRKLLESYRTASGEVLPAKPSFKPNI